MKKPVSEKAKKAWIENLAKWENHQRITAQLSDNKEMILIGFVLGFITCLLAGFIGINLFNL